MLAIFSKILAFEELSFGLDAPIGRCAYCSQPVSITEGNLVEELWTQLIWQTDDDAYFELIVPVDALDDDQFNAFREPLLCLLCLKQGIHQESPTRHPCELPKLRHICAWCGRELNTKELLSSDAPISHGICEDCMRRLED
jgi:hypothetical protein